MQGRGMPRPLREKLNGRKPLEQPYGRTIILPEKRFHVLFDTPLCPDERLPLVGPVLAHQVLGELLEAYSLASRT
jgi:hypothetical protein